MKKKWTPIVCLALALVLTVGLLAVLAPKTKAGSLPFRAGYCMVDVQPYQVGSDGLTVPLAGYGNTSERRADYTKGEEYDKLKGTAIALADENDNKVLLISFDGIRVEEVLIAAVRRNIHKETGIPEENVIINASHTHSAVDYTSGVAVGYTYCNWLIGQLTECALSALDDLAEVTGMGEGSTECIATGLDGNKTTANFSRHYLYKCIDKTMADYGKIFHADDQNTMYDATTKYSSNSKKFQYIGHTLPMDPTLYVVRFDRAGRRPILLMNFRAHPHTQGSLSDPLVTGDVVSAWRYELQNRGYDAAYYQGCSGMANFHSWYGSKEHMVSGLTNKISTNDRHLKEMGEKMADFTVKTFNGKSQGGNWQQVNTGTIEVKQTYKVFDHILTTKEEYDNARLVRDLQDKDTPENDQKAREILGKDYDESATKLQNRKNASVRLGMSLTPQIRSPYFANSVVSRYGRQPQGQLLLETVSVGDAFCIGTCPNELFHQASVWYEDTAVASGKYKMAMTFGYTNGSDAYLPTYPVWEYTSYETDVTHFVEGTAESVVKTFCDLLGVPYASDAPGYKIVKTDDPNYYENK